MTEADPHEEFLKRLRDPDVGRVGAREMLREVYRRLPGAWDPRVLDAARELTKRFPPLKEEFPLLEQWARIPVNAVMKKSLGAEETILAAVAAAARPDAERLLREVRDERGREKDARARILSALGRRMLEIGDRKNGRAALREAAQLAPAALRAEIEAILDDLPGAKGRDWRAGSGKIVISGNPSEPAALTGAGLPRTFAEERLLAAPLLVPAVDPTGAISIAVTLEHDMERVRRGTIRPKDAPTAPMIGLVVRDRAAPIAIVCGPFVSPLDRFEGASIPAGATHVSIRAGASFKDTRLEAVGAPNEGDGWLVIRSGRPFVRTRGGCWLRVQGTITVETDVRVRFRVTRAGMVYVARDVKAV